MAGRSPSGHEFKKRAFSFTAPLQREKPFHSADAAAAWRAAANRIAGGPDRRYSRARWAPTDVVFELIGFATQAGAGAMRRRSAEATIETRPAPEPCHGPQLGAAGARPS